MFEHMTNVKWLIAALCVLVTALVGAIAGREFSKWRDSKARSGMLEELRASSPMNLTEGDPFPSVDLLDLGGNSISAKELVIGKQAVVFFLAPTCDLCADVINAFRQEEDRLPSGVVVFAVCPTPPDVTRTYAQKLQLPFPVYCDVAQSFQSDYGMIAFPTLLTVDSEGCVQHINLGMTEDDPLRDVFRVLEQR